MGPARRLGWVLRKCGRRGWTRFSVRDQEPGQIGWRRAACPLAWPLPQVVRRVGPEDTAHPVLM